MGSTPNGEGRASGTSGRGRNRRAAAGKEKPMRRRVLRWKKGVVRGLQGRQEEAERQRAHGEPGAAHQLQQQERRGRDDPTVAVLHGMPGLLSPLLHWLRRCLGARRRAGGCSGGLQRCAGLRPAAAAGAAGGAAAVCAPVCAPQCRRIQAGSAAGVLPGRRRGRGCAGRGAARAAVAAGGGGGAAAAPPAAMLQLLRRALARLDLGLCQRQLDAGSAARTALSRGVELQQRCVDKT